MINRTNRDLVFAVMVILGTGVAIAQDVPPTGFQTGTELVVKWPDRVLQWNALTLATTATAAGKDPVAQRFEVGFGYRVVMPARRTSHGTGRISRAADFAPQSRNPSRSRRAFRAGTITWSERCRPFARRTVSASRG